MRKVAGEFPRFEIFDTEIDVSPQVLKDLLAEWETRGDKCLIFSRSTKLLRSLKFWMDDSYPNHLYLDGTIDQTKRLDLCDEFNNDPNVFAFLISTLTGGTGLNLQAANKVIIFDPSWNPAHDLQAMDRAYRWGQKRDVEVYRMVAAGSIEEQIYVRQIYKQQQANIVYDATSERRYFNAVEGEKQHKGELFGVRNLFSLSETLIGKPVIEQCSIAELGYALNRLVGDETDGDDEHEALVGGENNDDLLRFKEKPKVKKRKLKTSEDESSDEDNKPPLEPRNAIERILASNEVLHTHSNPVRRVTHFVIRYTFMLLTRKCWEVRRLKIRPVKRP